MLTGTFNGKLGAQRRWNRALLRCQSDFEGGCEHGLLGYSAEGPPQNPELICKTLCLCSDMFKLQSPSKSTVLDATHLTRHLFDGSKQFLNSPMLMPFSASSVSCFTTSTSAKRFPRRTVFNQGNRKSGSEQDPVHREGGTQGSCHLWSADYSAQCGQVCS